MAITKIGTITKSIHCPKCFALISWSSPQDETSLFGTRRVVCPECGKAVDVREAKITEDTEGN